MTQPWNVIAAMVRRLQDRVDALPSIREAVVATASPLTIRFDTDTDPITPHGTLVRVVFAGDRVVAVRIARYVWVLGVKNGTRRASGRVTITPSAAGVATAATITFPAGLFTAPPDVVIAGVSSPNATVGVSSITATGFTATIIRNSTTNTVVTWSAEP